MDLEVKLQNESDKPVLAEQFQIDIIQRTRVHLPTFHCEFEERTLASQAHKYKGFRLEPHTAASRNFTVQVSEDDEVSNSCVCSPVLLSPPHPRYSRGANRKPHLSLSVSLSDFSRSTSSPPRLASTSPSTTSCKSP